MSVNVANWNVRGNLGSDKFSADVWNGIENLREAKTDVIVLPEAWWVREYGAIDEAGINILAEQLDYNVHITPYESDIPPFVGDQHYIVTLYRDQSEVVADFKLGKRNAVKLHASDPVSMVNGEVYGVHFTSLNEDMRLEQASALLSQFHRDTVTEEYPPTVVVGDLNTMHPEDFRAKLLNSRAVREIATKVPHKQSRDLATRLTEMGEGRAISLLEQSDLRDADIRHRATMKLGRLALMQLDHIMINGRVRVEVFERHEFNGSDHLAISAKLGFLSVAKSIAK